MAKDDCNCPPEGAPEWVLTYGDLMSLLLTFFILIASFSEIKHKEFNAVVAAMRQTLGSASDGGAMPLSVKPSNSIISVLKKLRMRSMTSRKQAETDAKGIKGTQPQVKELRHGMMFRVGGPVTFEPGSADLSDAAKVQLKRLIMPVKGYNTIIELRGNAAAGEVGPDSLSPYKDVWQLSEARAEAVMKYLTSPAVGINPDRFRLVADGANEPLAERAYSTQQQAPNRRVEVIVSEDLVQQLQGRDGGAKQDQSTNATSMTGSNDG